MLTGKSHTSEVLSKADLALSIRQCSIEKQHFPQYFENSLSQCLHLGLCVFTLTIKQTYKHTYIQTHKQ